jgi:hypothetical protein
MTVSIKAGAARGGTLLVPPDAVAIVAGGRRKLPVKSMKGGVSGVSQESSFDQGLQKLPGNKKYK